MRPIGFTTYGGTVTASTEWGGPAERKRVRPAMIDSHESFLHDANVGRFWLDLGDPTVHDAMVVPRLERAIGVIYRPETERRSHYFHARLGEQFDAVIHLDHTEAVEPLERTSLWDRGEPPETYPGAFDDWLSGVDSTRAGGLSIEQARAQQRSNQAPTQNAPTPPSP